jgi:hypothetical protein
MNCGTFPRVAALFAVCALAACGGGGGGSSPSVTSDAPVFYVPGSTTLENNPITFPEGQSVQFEPQESGYGGAFSIVPVNGTGDSGCINTFPSSIANGQSFTSATASVSGCSSYPQSETYDVSDSNGHAATVTIQINAP